VRHTLYAVAIFCNDKNSNMGEPSLHLNDIDCATVRDSVRFIG